MRVLEPVGNRELNQRTGDILAPVRDNHDIVPLVYGRSHEPYAYVVPADAFESEARLSELAALLRNRGRNGASPRDALRPLSLEHRLDDVLAEMRDDSI